MAYTKKRGFIYVRFVKMWPNFIDCICTKTGRAITLQLRYKANEKLTNYINDLIEKKAHNVVRASHHPEPDMYWFCSVDRGYSHMGIRKKHEKRIAYENLLDECRKDLSPVHTGTIKQGLVLGRGGLPTSANTSGLIGGALIRNIHRPEVKELIALTKKKESRIKKLKEIRDRKEKAEKKYSEWIEEKKRADTDDNWEKFLREYEKKGKRQEDFIKKVTTDTELKSALLEEQKQWEDLRRQSGL